MTPDPAAVGYADLPGWIVFEHFGQRPDGTSGEFDFDYRMLWLVHADGTDLHELAPGSPTEGKSSPDISSDGTTVAFSSWRRLVRIWTAPIDGGPATLISTDCSGEEDDCREGDPAYSADGNSLAFVHLEAKAGPAYTEIGIRSLAGGPATYLEQTRVLLSEGYVSGPSWSAGGTEIVYTRSWKSPTDEHITDSRLFIASVGGSGRREMPRPEGEWAADPDWSPDGSAIVFSTMPNRETEGWGDFPGHPGIWTIAPDGTLLSQLCTTCLEGGWAPSWTPDGEHIMFWGLKSWALMDPDGANAAHINQPELTWFADGRGYGYAAVLQP